MSTQELVIDTSYDVKIEHMRNYNTITLEADVEEILKHFSVADIVAHFDEDDLLEEIGEQKCREHFDIE